MTSIEASKYIDNVLRVLHLDPNKVILFNWSKRDWKKNFSSWYKGQLL